MTLPLSGTISASQINTELGKSSSSIITLNDTDARALANVSSGTISFSNFHGKSLSSVHSFSIGNSGTTYGTVGAGSITPSTVDGITFYLRAVLDIAAGAYSGKTISLGPMSEVNRAALAAKYNTISLIGFTPVALNLIRNPFNGHVYCFTPNDAISIAAYQDIKDYVGMTRNLTWFT